MSDDDHNFKKLESIAAGAISYAINAAEEEEQCPACTLIELCAIAIAFSTDQMVRKDDMEEGEAFATFMTDVSDSALARINKHRAH